jgi:hypothetical protein
MTTDRPSDLPAASIPSGPLRTLLVALLIAGPASADPPAAETTGRLTSSASDTSGGTPAGGVEYGPAQVRQLEVGIRIRAAGACRGITASIPIPKDWPEQTVRIVNEEVSSEVRSVQYRELDEGVKQMLIAIPRLNANDVAEAILTFEIRRQPIIGPTATDQFQIPTRVPRDIRKFLGASPFIESRNGRVRSVAREILKDKQDQPAWAQVEAIYDYVREHVEYRESELKGAVDTLNDGQGDCEAMTSLFIALCRASKVPARMIWVMDHSYPEFYLEDAAGNGHWFPCQISGDRAFGSMPETRPILQKGDNFAIPETRERRRYVATQLKASTVRGAPPQITEVLKYVEPD